MHRGNSTQSTAPPGTARQQSFAARYLSTHRSRTDSWRGVSTCRSLQLSSGRVTPAPAPPTFLRLSPTTRVVGTHVTSPARGRSARCCSPDECGQRARPMRWTGAHAPRTGTARPWGHCTPRRSGSAWSYSGARLPGLRAPARRPRLLASALGSTHGRKGVF